MSSRRFRTQARRRLLPFLAVELLAITAIAVPSSPAGAAPPQFAVAASNSPKPAQTPAELSAIADAAAFEAGKARAAADKAEAALAGAEQNLRAAEAIVATLPPLAASHRSGDDAAAQQAEFQVTLAEAALQRAQQQEALALQSAAATIMTAPTTAPDALAVPNPLASAAQMETQNAQQAVEAARLDLMRAQQAAAAARQSAAVNVAADTASARDAALALANARSLVAVARAAASAADATALRLEAAAERARAAANAASAGATKS